ncbi:D-xylose transporter XylE [Priestia megaterium]|jgi:MFS transporter, SP family, xylose:H+ symportor|uniref:D-xylose transporter XylE n=1 Tax=Priestia megaterium TaxID=1404 RepID=UPI000BF92E95|nr:D-xylose transporter XylE [Priestia megaterium]MCM3151616.1 D-xylose transporter XylE [Priestia megaterium]MCU7739475.1 D-xylose transporter XylE [Priestia megaterium]MCU7744858.1 D-xylose transporter XylE [Priestia megaterium]MDC7722497.1 D-xylose transporter XylE [Priestia megaterium]PFQ81185.1 D-xylose transporter XylE [Priestia megaterium]
MKQNRNSLYIFSITLVAAIGGLLFGYDTAVISGAEESLKVYLIDSLGLGSLAHGVTVSSALIGCIIGGLVSGYFATKLGRKQSLILAAILFIVSALGASYPEFLFFTKGEPTLSLLLAFNFYRIIGGIGVGLASAICPIYIGEIAPADIRGRLVSFNQFMIIFGMLVVYFVNWGIANGETLEWINDVGWRYMFASGAIPALLFAALLFLVPETPRYLAIQNQDQKALAILTKINGSSEAKSILEDIKQTISTNVSSEKLLAYGKLVIVVGILLSVFQQFVGINVALYYAPRIFESMGAAKGSSMLQTIIMGLVNVIFTVIAILTVDRLGRKPLLITGSIGMAIGMFGVASMAFSNIIGIGTLVFIIIYTASFMMSWGPICWVLISEIFPNKIRGRAVAIAVAAQWAANYFISSTYPVMMEYSGGLTYGFYGLMSVLSALFVWKFVPETKGRTLEQMENMWRKKQGASKSKKAI